MTRAKGRGMGRREFLLTVGAATGAAVLGGSRSARAGRKPDESHQAARRAAPGPEVQALFGSLRAGRRLGPYTIVAVYDVHLGAIPVLLRAGQGETYQVDVLRRGPAAGVASTPSLGLYIASGHGRGKQTDEQKGLGAMALAAALARREAAGAKAPELLTIDERARRHPDGIFDVLG